MKSKSLRFLYFIPLIVLLLSSCSSGFTNDAIKNALNNEENCLKACDKMEEKAMADYEQCKKEALDWLVSATAGCTTVLCFNNALERYRIMAAKCADDYKKKLTEVNQCRKECRDKFPLELKLK